MTVLAMMQESEIHSTYVNNNTDKVCQLAVYKSFVAGIDTDVFNSRQPNQTDKSAFLQEFWEYAIVGNVVSINLKQPKTTEFEFGCAMRVWRSYTENPYTAGKHTYKMFCNVSAGMNYGTVLNGVGRCFPHLGMADREAILGVRPENSDLESLASARDESSVLNSLTSLMQDSSRRAGSSRSAKRG